MHTMGSLDTMGLLGNSFIELAEHQPIEKISVSDIVAASGKNRKTFYYHFESKEHLIRWVFRRDLADVLKANVADDDLLFEPEGDDSFPARPYYVYKKVVCAAWTDRCSSTCLPNAFSIAVHTMPKRCA